MRLVKPRDLYDLILLVLNKFSARLLSAAGEQRLARLIAVIAWTVQWRNRRIITDHLSAVVSRELHPDQTRKLTRKIYEGRWAEQFSYSAAKRKTACQSMTITGLEHLNGALSRGKGAILWEIPFGKRLLGKVALMQKGFAFSQVHDQEHGGSRSWLGQRFVRKFYRQAEGELFPEIIDIQADSLAYLRRLAERLSRNGIVCIPALGEKGHKFVTVEFLGFRRRIATGAVNLARMTGAPLLPIFCVKQEDGTDRLIVEQPITTGGSEYWRDAAGQGIQEYARLLESYIRRYPDQWYQWHRTVS